MSDVCSCFNLKRDAYYKHKRRADKRLVFEQQVVALVKQRRQSLPREGVRKLLKALDNDFNKQGLKVGRDALFNILRTHNMLTLRKKPTYKTTNSLHRFYKYKNCIKDSSFKVAIPTAILNSCFIGVPTFSMILIFSCSWVLSNRHLFTLRFSR